MKGLHIKLLIGLLASFGIVFAIMALYEPLWWKWYESDLKSSDEATRTAAAKTIAARGKAAIPHLREWLKSPNNNLVNGSCMTLIEMKGDKWKAAIPEIEEILNDPYSSKVHSVARVIVTRKYGLLDGPAGGSGWTKYKSDEYKTIRKNISIYLLSSPDFNNRMLAVVTLSKIKDNSTIPHIIEAYKREPHDIAKWAMANLFVEFNNTQAVNALIDLLQNSSKSILASYLTEALGNIGDNRAVAPLLSILGDSSNEACGEAALALGKIGCKEAVDRIIDVMVDYSLKWYTRSQAAEALGLMKNKKSVKSLIQILQDNLSNHHAIKSRAAFSLGQIGDNRAIEPLVSALENDSSSLVRAHAALALGNFNSSCVAGVLSKTLESQEDSNVLEAASFSLAQIGDNSSILPLINLLKTSEDEDVILAASIALARFNSPEIITFLERIRTKKPKVDIALCWIQGMDCPAFKPFVPKDIRLTNVMALIHDEYDFECLYHARWGNLIALQKTFSLIISDCGIYEYLMTDLFSRMPEYCPIPDFKANHAHQKIQKDKIQAWYKANKHRLAWDKEKRRYYLKEDNGENKDQPGNGIPGKSRNP